MCVCVCARLHATPSLIQVADRNKSHNILTAATGQTRVTHKQPQCYRGSLGVALVTHNVTCPILCVLSKRTRIPFYIFWLYSSQPWEKCITGEDLR